MHPITDAQLFGSSEPKETLVHKGSRVEERIAINHLQAVASHASQLFVRQVKNRLQRAVIAVLGTANHVRERGRFCYVASGT
jgi:hypothetical protein